MREPYRTPAIAASPLSHSDSTRLPGAMAARFYSPESGTAAPSPRSHADSVRLPAENGAAA